MEWFDRDFPGHYMRMIKHVTLTVIALVPPSEGIQATLKNTGISKIMVGPPFSEPKALVRQPESVSVTIPNKGTGLFEVDFNGSLLLPFEQSGVETFWTLELPKGSNRFSFETLIDVSMTIHYTAFESSDYRMKLLTEMGTEKTDPVTQRQYVETEVASQTFFSMHQRFPDQWYHFHNPVFLADQTLYGFGAGQTTPPYALRLELKPGHFAPNEENHTIRRAVIAVFGDLPGRVPLEISFRLEGSTTEHVIEGDLDQGKFRIDETTQTMNGTNFPINSLSPLGEWKIRIRTDATGSAYSGFFAGATTVNGQRKVDLSWIKDLSLVIQYQATTQYPL